MRFLSASRLYWTVVFASSITHSIDIVQDKHANAVYYYSKDNYDSYTSNRGYEEKDVARKTISFKGKLGPLQRSSRQKSDLFSEKSEKMRLHRDSSNEQENEKDITLSYEFVMNGDNSSLDLSTCCKSAIQEGAYNTISSIQGLRLDDEKSSHFVTLSTKRECFSSPKYFVKAKFFSQLVLAEGNAAITSSFIANEFQKSIENGELEENIIRGGVSKEQIGELSVDGGGPAHLLCANDVLPSASPTSEASSSPSLAPIEAPLSLLFQVALAGGKTASELSECCRDQVLDGARLSLSSILVGLDGRRLFHNEDEHKSRSLEKKCKQYLDYRQLYDNTDDMHTLSGSPVRSARSHFSDHSMETNMTAGAPVSAPAKYRRVLTAKSKKSKKKKKYKYCACDEFGDPIPPCEGDPPPRRTVSANLENILITRLQDNGGIVDVDFDIQIRTAEGSEEDDSVLEIVDEELTEEVKSGNFTANVQKQGLNVTVALGANTPSMSPSFFPSIAPTRVHSISPSAAPSSLPSVRPSHKPSFTPTVMPTGTPFDQPSIEPSESPTALPSLVPSSIPSFTPSSSPSLSPSSKPSVDPSSLPSSRPSSTPTSMPSLSPSISPSSIPSVTPSVAPSTSPSARPSSTPTSIPSSSPSSTPTSMPSSSPSSTPSRSPTSTPSATPTSSPSSSPTSMPSSSPSSTPSRSPTSTPSATPTSSPSADPSSNPSSLPSSPPSQHPSSAPSFIFKYVGCFIDKIDGRALPFKVGDFMNAEQCQTACDSKGYKYAGLQYWGECWCGDSGYDKYGTSNTCNCEAQNVGVWVNCVYTRGSNFKTIS